DDVDKIGRGRVWTGRQALGLGLVDDLGGFDRAVEVALELAEADPAEGAALTHFPKRKSLADMVLSGEILELGKASIIQEAGQALQRSVAPETVRWAWEPLRIR
ncbi:MAG: S49 family peptidase, partial [Gemmatimonadota bacterium]|nr:S49 family peptidase [Gemmatimonadota bacterium]